MQTLVGIYNRIARDVWHDADALGSAFYSDIQDALLQAWNVYKAYPFTFNEADWSSSFSTVVGQYNYSLPADLKRLYAVKLQASDGTSRRLDALSQATIDRLNATPSQTGLPVAYTVFNKQLRLSPIPNGVYPLKVSGLISLPLPALNGSNAWTEDGFSLLVYHAEALLWAGIKHDATMAAHFLSLANAESRRLLSEARMLAPTPQIDAIEL